jgi:hypothetical protein
MLIKVSGLLSCVMVVPGIFAHSPRNSHYSGGEDGGGNEEDDMRLLTKNEAAE